MQNKLIKQTEQQSCVLWDGDSRAGIFTDLLDCFTFSSYDSSTVAVVNEHAQRDVTVYQPRTHSVK